MKKILALVLAVAMLSTVAFAAITPTPGKSTTFEWTAFTNEDGKTPETFGGMKKYDFTSENFAVSVKYKKGADLVKEVKIDDDANSVKLTLKSSTSLLAPAADKAANLIVESITVKAKRSVKSGSSYLMKSGQSFKMDLNEEVRVGFEVKEETVSDAVTLTPDKITKIKADGNRQVGETAYEHESFMFEGKVYAGDKIFFGATSEYSDAAKDLAKANEDATIEYAKISLDGLSASHKVILNVEKDQKVYKLVDGKLAPSGLTWNEDEYAFTGKIRSTTEYVISDIELKGVTTTTPDTTNPDTGANDVVGIAAALAVVSLVAAGAVSLKK